jgi:magnesium chelatase subunit D
MVGRAEKAARRSGPLVPFAAGAALAWGPTLRAAAPYQKDRGKRSPDGRMILRRGDLRAWAPRGAAGCLRLFLVDTSGSMAAWRRMRQTKAAILALLAQAYQRRDRVALLAFHGTGAELVLPPRRGLAHARRALEALPTGGATPLAAGLAAGRRLLQAQKRRDAQQPIWTVLLTDGRANVAVAGGDPWREALAEAQRLAACATACLVVNTEAGWPRLGRAAELARALRADCLPLEDVLGRPLPDPWRQAI